MTVHETKTFKSGNSIALRLPKELGVRADEMFEVVRDGDTLTARRVVSPDEEAERLQRFQQAMAELARLGSIGEIEQRAPFVFPDRPGLS